MHPLAQRLIARIGTHTSETHVLEIGAGSGRNTRGLQSAGFTVVQYPATGTFDAAIATHALLHGSEFEVGKLLKEIADSLQAGAPLHATFGSVRDARFGTGTQITGRTFSPVDGDEAGVAHTYYDEPPLRALLEPLFIIERLEEYDVDAVAGKWAHPQRPLRGAVHWFAELTRRYGAQ